MRLALLESAIAENLSKLADSIAKRMAPEEYAHTLEVARGLSGDEEVLALLHDVIENGASGLEELMGMFPDSIIEALRAITRGKGEAYADYILRVKKNLLATKVKIKDLNANLARPEKGDLRQRYERALGVLGQ